MSFLRQGEIYHFGEGATTRDRAPAHRNDEFPAGYSLAGCSPAEPASASPAGAQLAGKPVRSTIEFQRTADSVLTVCLTQGDNPTYSTEHPKGNKYRPEELKPRRDQVYDEFTTHLVPPVHYEITQKTISGKDRDLPDVGFVLTHYGESLPVQAKVKVHVVPADSEPILIDGYYSGERLWNLNPRFSVWGHFRLPDETPKDGKELRLRVTVIIIDRYGREHAHLPVEYLYIEGTKSWSLEP